MHIFAIQDPDPKPLRIGRAHSGGVRQDSSTDSNICAASMTGEAPWRVYSNSDDVCGRSSDAGEPFANKNLCGDC